MESEARPTCSQWKAERGSYASCLTLHGPFKPNNHSLAQHSQLTPMPPQNCPLDRSEALPRNSTATSVRTCVTRSSHVDITATRVIVPEATLRNPVLCPCPQGLMRKWDVQCADVQCGSLWPSCRHKQASVQNSTANLYRSYPSWSGWRMDGQDHDRSP